MPHSVDRMKEREVEKVANFVSSGTRCVQPYDITVGKLPGARLPQEVILKLKLYFSCASAAARSHEAC